jgi:hypothetical protein
MAAALCCVSRVTMRQCMHEHPDSLHAWLHHQHASAIENELEVIGTIRTNLVSMHPSTTPVTAMCKAYTSGPLHHSECICPPAWQFAAYSMPGTKQHLILLYILRCEDPRQNLVLCYAAVRLSSLHASYSCVCRYLWHHTSWLTAAQEE